MIPLTLFGFQSMRDTWLEAKVVEEEKDYNNDADDGDFGHHEDEKVASHFYQIHIPIFIDTYLWD